MDLEFQVSTYLLIAKCLTEGHAYTCMCASFFCTDDSWQPLLALGTQYNIRRVSFFIFLLKKLNQNFVVLFYFVLFFTCCILDS